MLRFCSGSLSSFASLPLARRISSHISSRIVFVSDAARVGSCLVGTRVRHLHIARVVPVVVGRVGGPLLAVGSSVPRARCHSLACVPVPPQAPTCSSVHHWRQPTQPTAQVLDHQLVDHSLCDLPSWFVRHSKHHCLHQPHQSTERERERDQKQLLANDTQLHEPTNEPNSLSCDGYHVLEIVMEAEMTNGNGNGNGMQERMDCTCCLSEAGCTRQPSCQDGLRCWVTWACSSWSRRLDSSIRICCSTKAGTLLELDGSLSFYRSIAGS